MATRYQGPGTTSAGAFFQNQRAAPGPAAGYMPKPAINMNASMSSLASSMSGMPQPQMQPLAQPRTRQGSNGGTPRTPGSTGSGGGGGGGSGKRMDRKDTKDTAWVHWRALREFLAAWADKGEFFVASSKLRRLWQARRQLQEAGGCTQRSSPWTLSTRTLLRVGQSQPNAMRLPVSWLYIVASSTPAAPGAAPVCTSRSDRADRSVHQTGKTLHTSSDIADAQNPRRRAPRPVTSSRA